MFSKIGKALSNLGEGFSGIGQGMASLFNFHGTDYNDFVKKDNTYENQWPGNYDWSNLGKFSTDKDGNVQWYNNKK